MDQVMFGMHPADHATRTPDKPALVMARSGASVSYAALDAAANRTAHMLRELGLVRGDVVAGLFDNGPEVFSFSWGTQRSGLYLTSISNKLGISEIAYILEDSGTRLLLVSDALIGIAEAALTSLPDLAAYAWSTTTARLANWCAMAERQPPTPIGDESPGSDLLYSSGTTGRPKGVVPALPAGPIDHPTPLTAMATDLYGMNAATIYLSTSPLYHAAPLRWAMTVQRLGGTVIVMEAFDAENALALIACHRITHGTFVPTHFIRMLKLPRTVRDSHDLTSLRAVIHAAAPCPVPVKQAMIDWLGPIVFEYYSGTETCGITALSSAEWLAHPGSVGRAILGVIKVVDDCGNEVTTGEQGQIFFADGPRFAYLNDPQKTRNAYNDRGWASFGDVGHVDADGYLYLTDRKSFMIISGGVNIYPQVIENHLVTHPQVADVAVFGVPHPEMGEQVVAIVQPTDWAEAGDDLAEELMRFAREGLGGVSTPRRLKFQASLPREPTGKLMKRHLIRQYLQNLQPEEACVTSCLTIGGTAKYS